MSSAKLLSQKHGDVAIFRYPDDLMEPLPEELNVAIEGAERFLDFVYQLLKFE